MPIEIIFQVVFWFFQEVPGIAIIVISLVMNFLALPLYKRADAIHEEEKQKSALMAPWVSRIRAAFQGDERYMMLQTYYRQQNYKPVYALRGSLSLLLQIPFFIAAYHFLSHSQLLGGRSFWFLQDLGAPDQLLQFGSVTLNLMPVVMTLINVLSAWIYLRGSSVRDKLQTYGIAVIFLVLLYNSPSGLVFYWTLNQIFSVLKNVFMKLVKSQRVRGICFSCIGILILVLLAVWGFLGTGWRIVLAILICLAFQLPLLTDIRTHRRKLRNRDNDSLSERQAKGKTKIPTLSSFLPGGVLMAVLTGIVVPLSVIHSSPNEFVTEATDPVILVLQNFCICTGVFVVWFGVYYLMFKNTARKLFLYGVFLLSGIFMLDYIVFNYSLGSMSSYLIFTMQPTFSLKEKLLNLLVIALLAGVFYLIWKFLGKIVPYIYGILIAGCLVLSGWYAVSTIQDVAASADDLAVSQSEASEEEGKILTLSKSGHNVVIIMLDRAISGYVPYIFNEKPQLVQQFAGFTYFPNTVSFGSHTNYSAPSLYGGYEYTPYNMNLRTDEAIPEKHNEAMRLLPILFSEEGYEVTICDPLYAGYQKFVPDLSVYDDLENVTAMVTYGLYGADLMSSFESAIQMTQKRNFFFFSLFRVMPTVLKNAAYNNGNYYYTTSEGGLSCSDEFLYAYSVLKKLPSLTDVEEDGKDQLFILNNNTTHAPSILQTPEYEPVVQVTSEIFADQDRFTLGDTSVKMDNIYEIAHYHVNMAAFLKIGEWLDYLREQGVYDNTRIIILSDHGISLGQFDDLIVSEEWDAQWVNSLLMYKDFGEIEFTVSDTFMTAADMPTLAVQNLIANPVNPVTGYDITTPVNKEEQLITSAHNWDIDVNRGITFDTSDGYWWKVHGNVHDASSWELVGK